MIPLGVRARQGRGKVARGRHDGLDRWPLPFGDLLAQRMALDELRRDVQLSVELLQRIHRADARMRQHRRGARFAAQAVTVKRLARQLRRKRL